MSRPLNGSVPSGFIDATTCASAGPDTASRRTLGAHERRRSLSRSHGTSATGLGPGQMPALPGPPRALPSSLRPVLRATTLSDV